LGINKVTATEWIASFLGLGLDTIVAAGDSYNDLPLLRSAALAIVMGDAPSELKSVADYIAPPVCEDGLAVAIEEFLIPRLDGFR
jgi:hydroxymethylpyrimidine pyrophosphatase-like HAD family hydrolase